MKNLILFFCGAIKNLLIISRKNVKNFIIFAIIVGLVNLTFRTTLIHLLSPVGLSRNAVIGLTIFITVSTILSIFIFYIRFYHATSAKKIAANFIDFDRIEQNKIRWAYLEEEAKKQFPNINFNIRFLIIILPFWFLLILKLQESGKPNIILSIFFILFSICYILYLRLIKQAIIATKIPLDKEPIPPKVLKVWWYFTHSVLDYLHELLYGNSKSRNVELSSELEYQILRNRNRYWRFALIAGVLGGLATTEIWLYSGSPYIPPTSRLKNLIFVGYYSNFHSVLEKAWHLDEIGCQMKTFCHPGTKKLDSRAIHLADKYIQTSLNEGKIPGQHVPLPQGPYLQNSIIPGTGEVDKSPFPKIDFAESSKQELINEKKESSIE